MAAHPADAHVESPRLAEFRRRSGRGGRTGADRAWKRLAAAGLPLIEPIPGAPQQRLLTVVWKDPPAGARPSIFASVGTIDPEELALRPLGRTGVWYKSFRLPARSRISYGPSALRLPVPSAPAKARVKYWPSIRPIHPTTVTWSTRRTPTTPRMSP